MAVIAADVIKIIGSDASDSVVEAFIETAQCLIDSVAACITGKGISDECLDKAIAFLAAHLLSSSTAKGYGKTKKKESFENYSVEYAMADVQGQGIMSTPYGQTANALTGGCLQEVGKRNPSINFFGGYC